METCCMGWHHDHRGGILPPKDSLFFRCYISFQPFYNDSFRRWFFLMISESQTLLNNAWSNVRNVPAESVETCWRENWAVVIFGLAYVCFRSLPISIPMCAWLNIYFTSPIKTADNQCNYSPGASLSTRWYNMTGRRMSDVLILSGLYRVTVRGDNSNSCCCKLH